MISWTLMKVVGLVAQGWARGRNIGAQFKKDKWSREMGLEELSSWMGGGGIEEYQSQLHVDVAYDQTDEADRNLQHFDVKARLNRRIGYRVFQ